MLKSVFFPDRSNMYAWANVAFMILLLVFGKIEASTVLFGYFLETLVIGVFNVFKIYATYKYHDKKTNIIYNIVFFIFHYGGFVAIQSIFVFAIFSTGNQALIKAPFHILSNLKAVLSLDGMQYVLPLLVSTQLLKYIFDFLSPKKYMKFKVEEMMFKPYVRIIIQQFTVIIAMFFMVFSQASLLAAVLLIMLRFLVDFFFVAIKENSELLDYVVQKIDTGKVDKATLRRQILLFTE